MCISHYIKFYRHVTLQRISWQNSVFEDYKFKISLCPLINLITHYMFLYIQESFGALLHKILFIHSFSFWSHAMNICMLQIYIWEDVTVVCIFLIAGVGCQRAPKAGCSAVVREQEAKHLSKWPHQQGCSSTERRENDLSVFVDGSHVQPRVCIIAQVHSDGEARKSSQEYKLLGKALGLSQQDSWLDTDEPAAT